MAFSGQLLASIRHSYNGVLQCFQKPKAKDKNLLMTAAQKTQTTPTASHHLSFSLLWLALRSPEMLAGSMLAVAAVVALGAIIPQQPANFSTPADFVVWLSDLPQFYRQAFQFFNLSGLFTIYHTAWFWLPAAWLVLVCLIALADYAPATLIRLKKPGADFFPELYPHPLSYQRRVTLRLTAPQNAAESTVADSDATLAELQQNLSRAGFAVARPGEPGVAAARHRWRWLAPVLLPAGCLLLIAGVIAQTVGGQTETVLLSAQSPRPVAFIGAAIRLASFTPFTSSGGNLLGGQLALATAGDKPVLARLHQPGRLNGWWLIPTKLQPAVEISFGDQAEAEKMAMVIPDIAQPIHFAYPDKNLLFELRYQVAPPHYRLALTNAPGRRLVLQKDGGFSVPGAGLTGRILIEDKVLLKAYKIPGLAFFLLGGLSLLAGSVMLFSTAPALVTLRAITKGRGSKIEALIETPGYNPAAEAIINAALLLEQEAAND